MNSSKKHVVIVSFSDLKRDPRVYRQICFIKQNNQYRITAVGLGDPEIEKVEFYPINFQSNKFMTKVSNAVRLKVKDYERYYWSSPLVQDAIQKLGDLNFDLIIANDLDALPLSLHLARKSQSKILLDAHEYGPRQFEDRWVFRFFFQGYWDYICRTYLPHTDAMITVCDGIAEEYSHIYNVKCDVLNNAPFYTSVSPAPVDTNCIRMIHHGSLNKSRKIENMILLMDLLDERFTLDFMVIPNQVRYLRQLHKLAQGRTCVNFRHPVPMPEISRTLNEYDIGLYLLDDTSFNKRMALPNKFFEFIQGRLAVAIWPSPEMARLVHETNCGIVAKEFTIKSMAEELNKLSVKDIKRFKNNSHQAARTLCAEENCKAVLDMVRKLIG